MEYPTLKVKQKSRQMLDAFLGYNHNLRIGDGEFYDMQNMTSDYYPVLAPRGNRGLYKDDVNASAIIAKDKLCYVDGEYLVVGDQWLYLELDTKKVPKQLVSMGSFVIILPDKIWVNTSFVKEGVFDSGRIEHQKIISTNTEDDPTATIIYFHLCDEDGVVYTDDKVRPGEKPVEEDGNLWLDTDTIPPVLKRYSKTNGSWMVVPKTYVKISCPGHGIGVGFEQGDGIELSGIEYHNWSNLNGVHTVVACGEDYIVIEGMPNHVDYQDDELENGGVITFARKMPDMDFVIESNNRLWGCRYGYNNKGDIVNEIYASKLGDFKNWHCFAGISTDSYAVSCGTDGQFTGAINHLGYPLFFKENCVHKVYGDYPANFRLQNTSCRGVQKGSHNSLAIVNETLFYKSSNAVCAYDGSLPVEMSTALGEVHYSDAVACGHGNKYYIDMKNADGNYHLFVYDTGKRMWHKEDNLQVDAFCSYNGEIYAIESGQNRIITLLGSGTKDTDPVQWMVETGIVGMSMPDMKYISRLLIRMALEIGASVEISIQYDSMGKWEQVCLMTATSLRSFAVPIRPRRCDHFRIRINGVGQGKVYSITKTIEQGSDVS